MSKGASTTTATQKSEPWEGVQPYLLGSQTTRLKQGVTPIYKTEQVGNPTGGGGPWWANVGSPGTGETKSVLSNPESDYETVGSPGIFAEAQRLYQSGGWTPEMQAVVDEQSKNLAGRADQANRAYGVGNAAINGKFDPRINRVGNIAGADKIVAQTVDPTKAFASLGEANPTGAIQQMLTGRADTSTIDPVVQSAFRRLGEGFNEQVLPGIRGNAIASGQYGGSRQGIAEGLASRGLLYSMGDVANNMYNQAYQQAQQNMYGTANNMAGLGINNSQSNANRDLSAQTSNASNQLAAQTFNATLGLQNNQQAMQLAQQQLANRTAGLNVLGMGNALQDQNYQQRLGLLNAADQYNWNNLNNYSSIVQNGARLGGTATASQPYFTNPLGNAIGLGLGGLGLYNGLGKAGLLGGAGAAGAAATSAALPLGATDLIDAMAFLA
jgi:hypothetical protein